MFKNLNHLLNNYFSLPKDPNPRELSLPLLFPITSRHRLAFSLSRSLALSSSHFSLCRHHNPSSPPALSLPLCFCYVVGAYIPKPYSHASSMHIRKKLESFHYYMVFSVQGYKYTNFNVSFTDFQIWVLGWVMIQLFFFQNRIKVSMIVMFRYLF